MSNDDLVMKTLLDIERTLGGVATEVKGMRADLQAHVAKDEAYQSDAGERLAKVERRQDRSKYLLAGMAAAGGGGAYKLLEFVSAIFGGVHHR